MKVLTIVIILTDMFWRVIGHGRLIEPPSRSSMWRFGFDSPKNFNDNELFCGGVDRQFKKNGGKCGPCGDPWDAPRPRANEGGGKYGKGVIVRKYRRGQTVKVGIQVTTNHKGHFEFRLCPHNNPRSPASEWCFNSNLLRVEGGGTKWKVGKGRRVFAVQVHLPSRVTCTQCVLMWRYVTGNSWGYCKNETNSRNKNNKKRKSKGRLGCGSQEEFRGCADIAISTNGAISKKWKPPSKPKSKPTKRPGKFKPTSRPGKGPTSPTVGWKQTKNGYQSGDNFFFMAPLERQDTEGDIVRLDNHNETSNFLQVAVDMFNTALGFLVDLVIASP